MVEEQQNEKWLPSFKSREGVEEYQRKKSTKTKVDLRKKPRSNTFCQQRKQNLKKYTEQK